MELIIGRMSRLDGQVELERGMHTVGKMVAGTSLQRVELRGLPNLI